MPILSIVIPNHDYSRFFARCFNSLATQTRPLSDVEIIFVDDESGDDSLERVAEWAERLDCERFVIEPLTRQGRPGPVRNNPDFFHPLVRQWADDLRRGRLHAQPFPRGHIPSPDDVRAMLKAVEGAVLGTPEP